MSPPSNSSGLVLPAGPRLPGAPAPKEGDAVKVTLHDCLACSGCVTTAETMLLEQQSVQELRAALARPGTHVVVSVAPQSLAALAGESCLALGKLCA
jgi:iron only hydrogenase large subunit-like protein